MNRNSLYFLIGALVVIVIGLGIYVYHQQTKPKGVDIQIGQHGVFRSKATEPAAIPATSRLA